MEDLTPVLAEVRGKLQTESWNIFAHAGEKLTQAAHRRHMCPGMPKVPSELIPSMEGGPWETGGCAAVSSTGAARVTALGKH